MWCSLSAPLRAEHLTLMFPYSADGSPSVSPGSWTQRWSTMCPPSTALTTRGEAAADMRMMSQMSSTEAACRVKHAGA